MRDKVLKKYLPELDQLSGKMPERDFFQDYVYSQVYLKDIMTEANHKRFKVDKDGDKKDAIKLSDAWLDERMKHPYHFRKAGTGVYLLRESAKVSKVIKDRKIFKLSKRLGGGRERSYIWPVQELQTSAKKIPMADQSKSTTVLRVKSISFQHRK